MALQRIIRNISLPAQYTDIQQQWKYLREFLQTVTQWHNWTSIFFGLFASSLFINILSLALPLVLLQVYDRIIPQKALDSLSLLVLIVITAIAIEIVLRILRTIITGWAGARYEYFASRHAYEHLLKVKILEYDKHPAGFYFESMNAIRQLKDFHSGQALVTLFDAPFILIFLLLMAYIAGSLVLVPIITLSILIWLIAGRSLNLKKSMETKQSQSNNRTNFLIETLGGIHTLKAMAMEALLLRRYERLQDQLTANNRAITLTSADIQTLTQTMMQLTIVLTVATGSLSVISGEITIGVLAACTLLAGRVLQPAGQTLAIWQRLQNMKIAQQELESIYQLSTVDNEHAITSGIEHGVIKLNNLSFGYVNEPLIIDDVNFTIAAGSTVALTSDAGTGKTSLLKLILGHLQPRQGNITIDDVDITRYNTSYLHRQVSYIPQNGVIFNGSILDNITMFRPEYNREAQQLALQLGLDVMISPLPKGYDTEIGTQAVGILPPGAKQLIIIARGFIGSPKVVLFDEANLSLDLPSDQRLQQFFDKIRGDITLILVTHRPSLMRLADVIYRIKDKQLMKINDE